VSPALVSTVEMPNSIPFLRDPRNVDNQSVQKLPKADFLGGYPIQKSMPKS